MRSSRLGITVRQIMLNVLGVAVSIALVLPAVRVLRNGSKPFHHHILMHRETGEVVIWYHPNVFLSRYWPEFTGRVRSGDRACERAEERRRHYEGFSDLDASYDLSPLIRRHWILRSRDQNSIIQGVKAIQIDREVSGEGNGELRLRGGPDLYDDTRMVE